MRANETLSARVAEEIRVALVRRRMAARQLAQLVGLSQSAMSARLTGVTPIDLDELQRIAAALDVDVTELLPAATRTGDGGGGQLKQRYDVVTERRAVSIGRGTPALANPPVTQPIARLTNVSDDPATRRPVRLTTPARDGSA